MQLSQLFSLLSDLRFAIRAAAIPTLKAIYNAPRLLLRPRELSRIFMAYVWDVYGDGTDDAGKIVKEGLITRYARGIVLDMGAGHGHLVKYLNKSHVTAYIALEPNVSMHGRIKQKALDAGFSEENGSFLLLPYGAEDIDSIRASLAAWSTGPGKAHSAHNTSETGIAIDTLTSILTLCSIPNPLNSLRALVRGILKPGGQLLFYEHVRNPRADVAWWQDVVAPVWRVCFDGCVIGLDGVEIIKEAIIPGEGEVEDDTNRSSNEEGWASMETWEKEGEDPENLFWHQVGRCVKNGADTL